MLKPVYHLWKSDFQTEDAFLQEKRKYTDFGFRVVTYQDGQNSDLIQLGLKELIKNHYQDEGGFHERRVCSIVQR